MRGRSYVNGLTPVGVGDDAGITRGVVDTDIYMQYIVNSYSAVLSITKPVTQTTSYPGWQRVCQAVKPLLGPRDFDQIFVSYAWHCIGIVVCILFSDAGVVCLASLGVNVTWSL